MVLPTNFSAKLGAACMGGHYTCDGIGFYGIWIPVCVCSALLLSDERLVFFCYFLFMSTHALSDLSRLIPVMF